MAQQSSQMTSPSHRLYALASMMILIVNIASTHAKPVAIPPPVHQEAGPIALNPGIHGTMAGVQQALPPSLAMAAFMISKDDDDDGERGLSFGVKFGNGKSSHRSSSHSSEDYHHHHRRSSHHHHDDHRRGTSSSVVKTFNVQSTYHNDVDPYSGRGTVVKSKSTQVAATSIRDRHRPGGYAPGYNDNNGFAAPSYAIDQQPYYRGGGYNNNIGGRNQWGRGQYK